MPCGGPIAALYGFGKKFGRKIDENMPIFFFRKKHFKTRSETQFHQNHQFRANFRLKNVQDLKNPLPLKVDSTVDLDTSKSLQNMQIQHLWAEMGLETFL